MSKRAEKSFAMEYDPEMDVSSELSLDAASHFQSIVDIIRLMIKVVRIEIITKLSLLSSYLALPQVGHLEEATHKMANMF